VSVEKLEVVPERTQAKMMESALYEQVTKLIRILKAEEKVI
jgi:hypothetical protein